jgi:hypothetical protein
MRNGGFLSIRYAAWPVDDRAGDDLRRPRGTCTGVWIEVGHTARAVLDAVCKGLQHCAPFLSLQAFGLKLADPAFLSIISVHKMYIAPNDCNGIGFLFFQSAQTSAAHVLLADHDATNELVLVHSCGGWQTPALSEEHTAIRPYSGLQWELKTVAITNNSARNCTPPFWGQDIVYVAQHHVSTRGWFSFYNSYFLYKLFPLYTYSRGCHGAGIVRKLAASPACNATLRVTSAGTPMSDKNAWVS